MADITMRVNGATRTGSPEARKTLADFLRDDLNLTGTHVGCGRGLRCVHGHRRRPGGALVPDAGRPGRRQAR